VTILLVAVIVLLLLQVWKSSILLQCNKVKEMFVPAPYPDTFDESLLEDKEPEVEPMSDDPTLALRSIDSDLADTPMVPKEEWAALAPPDAGLRSQQLLSPEKFIGLDTKANSNKNANYDLRSAPSVPKVEVGPWNRSTYEADPFRRPLE